MALQLLDGTSAAVNLTIDYQAYECHLNNLAVEFNRQTFQMVTFCSSNWETSVSGMKNMLFVGTGFLAKGDAASKLGQYMLDDDHVWVVATFDTGCTVSAESIITRDSGNIAGAGLSGRTIEGRNAKDSVAVAWVVA